ncbi:MAG: hypothetical protein RRZ83_06625 [Alistipes sp.]
MKRILLIGMLMWVSGVTAQQRFDYIERSNPWNNSVNAAGVRQDTVSRSYAEAYCTKINGGFMDKSSSDNSWNAGARTQSIRHFNKISFFGHFAYDYFDGRNMCGSMFSHPNYYPVDILEFTPGRKVRETYTLTGGVAAVLGAQWTGGLRVDFEAQNYAKRKDLRHKNTNLDFDVAPSILYHAERWAVGASYIFGKNSERIEAEQIGKLGTSYYAFFDKGLSYGSTELWNGNTIHLAEPGINGFPIKEMIHGASLQGQYGPFYADVTYRHRNGDTGEKDVKWHTFKTSQIVAHTVLRLQGDVYHHFIRLNLDWQEQKTRENLVGKETVNGITQIHTYGSTPIFGLRSLDIGGEYEIVSNRIDFRAGVAYSQLNRQSTLMYPYVKGQKLHYTALFAKGIWTFGAFDLMTGLDYRVGDFSESNVKLVPEMVTGDYSLQLTEYYNWSNEYLTASRLGVDLGLRYNIKKFYIDLSARLEHGFDLQYITKSNRGVVTLGVGYNF